MNSGITARSQSVETRIGDWARRLRAGLSEDSSPKPADADDPHGDADRHAQRHQHEQADEAEDRDGLALHQRASRRRGRASQADDEKQRREADAERGEKVEGPDLSRRSNVVSPLRQVVSTFVASIHREHRHDGERDRPSQRCRAAPAGGPEHLPEDVDLDVLVAKPVEAMPQKIATASRRRETSKPSGMVKPSGAQNHAHEGDERDRAEEQPGRLLGPQHPAFHGRRGRGQNAAVRLLSSALSSSSVGRGRRPSSRPRPTTPSRAGRRSCATP